MSIAYKNPYIGPRTFQRDERHLFFGREREARELLGLIITEQLVLFYSQSGAGKSSLVNTCLIPDLERKGFKVLPIGRVSGDVRSNDEVDNIFVFNLIRSLARNETGHDIPGQSSLAEFLIELQNTDSGYAFAEPETPGGRSHRTQKRVLIIDQFEELFSTHPEAWRKREGFFEQLAQAMQLDSQLSIVLVMREDYIAALDPFTHLVPGMLRARYYMQRLGYAGALKAIKSPVEKDRPFAPGVAEKLVDDLGGIKVQKPDGTWDIQAGQYVEPVQLQVVCSNLWNNLPAEVTQITEYHLQEIGDVNTSLGDYYAMKVKAVAQQQNVNERWIRTWFGAELISPGGLRNLVLQEPNKSRGLDQSVIRALQGDLVRAEVRGGLVFYELIHDRLVAPILENNKRWFEEHLSPLQRQAALWKDQYQNENWLLTDQALLEMEQWARDHKDELTEPEDEFLNACRTRQKQVEERREAEHLQVDMARRLAVEQARSAQRARRFVIISAILVVIAVFQSFLILRRTNNAQNLAITLLIMVALLVGYFFGRSRSK